MEKFPDNNQKTRETDWDSIAEEHEANADDYAVELRELHEKLSDLSLSENEQKRIEDRIAALEEERNISEKYAEDAREMGTKDIKPPKEGAASMDQGEEYYIDSQGFVHTSKENAREADARN
ncbi:hypothetical protein IJI91_02765 [Candidatus Saccharibacteria bacterium]|nr:hypothetical protein [Candidatus Saccharibacteria bacterium]